MPCKVTECVGLCSIDRSPAHCQRCAGCLRSLDLISRWGSMTKQERVRVLEKENVMKNTDTTITETPRQVFREKNIERGKE